MEEEKESPNIYWIHMDGMPNIEFIQKYYERDLSEYMTSFYDNHYSVNSDASFVGGAHTLTSLSALFNPMYYDHFFHDYLTELETCKIKKCTTKETVDLDDLTDIRYQNELFQGLSKKGYTMISIAEFNIYTSMNTQYVYDICNVETDHRIKYFENHYDEKDLYRYVLKEHLRIFTNKKFHNTLAQKEIEAKIQLKDYPTLNQTKYIPMKAIMKSIEDASSINQNPKFYFIDNTIIHLNWNYTEDGELIREQNENLDDFDKTIVYSLKLLNEMIQYLKEHDPNAVVIIQSDHGIHYVEDSIMKKYYHLDDEELLNVRNSTFSAIYIPEEYQNGEEEYLDNPLNISRYLVNHFVGENYEYLN